ncbi:MAG: zinc-binding dehydrogenase [Spirochaetaceae bacterium]|jgi:threonine dehydrogenase-like Zn-dependent dehydrogenase|nr:zinc-binding dehydrogenase [Spirochaetaceae bacterium]
MKSKAVRIYGVNDLRLDEFELPDIKDDEILASVVSDSICMSSHKLAMQGDAHKRVWHKPLSQNPAIIGHEFCGNILKVGAKWKGRYTEGAKYAVQPSVNIPDEKGLIQLWSPGYSYPYLGGDATYVIFPNTLIEMGCILDYSGNTYFMAGLAEPVSCVLAAFHGQYHTIKDTHRHDMGIVPGGATAILGGAGPMGLAATDFAIHNARKPGLLVITDINQPRLQRAESLQPPSHAGEQGVNLQYINPTGMTGPEQIARLKALNGGRPFDDVFVFYPDASLVGIADALLAHDGCLNFFAGPVDKDFSASFNFYGVHYNEHHLAGTSGGNTEDMRESLQMIQAGILHPEFMVSHIGGLNTVADTTINLDKIPGGKKLIYTQKNLPLIAIEDFGKQGTSFYDSLADICSTNNNLWCKEAEDYLLAHAPDI